MRNRSIQNTNVQLFITTTSAKEATFSLCLFAYFLARMRRNYAADFRNKIRWKGGTSATLDFGCNPDHCQIRVSVAADVLDHSRQDCVTVK